MPWWVKAIGLIGVPSAIALFFSWTLVADIKSTLDELNTSVTILINQNAADREQDKIERTQDRNTLNNIWLATAADCVNTAQTETERNRCLGWEPLVR